ncbi:MAG TPA: NUDIX domain-containing protein [Burkholderiales bacterium]|nr:NUDIX domain-containing protein [Burkholderiales bacterium]
MASKTSAGILLYRIRSTELQVFIVHPGGPFWAGKDAGAWSIPKGEPDQDSDLLEAAKREFHEETGKLVTGEFLALTPLRQPSGKTVHAWAIEGDIDPSAIKSNTFAMEWPPRSGKQQEFPEVDRGGWFAIAEAKKKLAPGQMGFLAELQEKLGLAQSPGSPSAV